MLIREIQAKAILSKSRIRDYTLNAYVGCEHRCIYCYARFMKRFTGHREAWGEFVDAKTNAAELLVGEVRKKKKGTVWISGVCDAYQPAEQQYLLTRRCLEILVDDGWPVNIQTKSPLVLRDIGILKRAANAEVGFTITSADERMRQIFEPGAPAMNERIGALEILHGEGIRTFVMVAPILPGADRLVEKLKGRVDYALIDRDNYAHADWVYKKYGMEWAKDEAFFRVQGEALKTGFESEGIACQKLY
jgi:DNA repair photolyase